MHLKAHRCVRRAISIICSDVRQITCADVSYRNLLIGLYSHAAELECACRWQTCDHHLLERLAAVVI